MTAPGSEAAYFRNWRRTHPGYRTREVKRVADRRRRIGREDRTVEYANRAAARDTRALEPMPTLHHGHPLFDQARLIVGPDRSGLTILHDPLYDDLISVATLALLRGEDATEAVRRYRASELNWRRRICPIAMELVA